MPLLRAVRQVGFGLHVGGAGTRQLGQATFPDLGEAAAQRFEPFVLSGSVAA